MSELALTRVIAGVITGIGSWRSTDVAFDLIVEKDETLHWHDFEAVTWVIAGTGAFRNGDGELIEVSPGCRLDAPAGFLHRNLAGPPVRVVLATNLPYGEWTMPIDKDPADRPEYLSV